MWFLRSVIEGSVIQDFDWCSYIITCLKRTKIQWSGTEHYNGPLCFLALKIKKNDAKKGDDDNVVPNNVADDNVMVPDNVCGEAHEDEGNVDIIGSVSLIPTAVIDKFIEGLLTPDPTNSPAGLSTCSPFYGGAHQGEPQNEMKKVNLVVKRSRLEDNVASTIFCANKDDSNFLFESTRAGAGAAITRVTFESLYPGVDLHVSVLDCWADVLNSEDQYRNKSDPKRLFTPCLMLVDSHYKDDVEEVDRITSFTENMEICLKSAELDSLIGVDMLLIPMLHACHYYVLCFNLNKTQFFVIDNIGTDVDFDIKYAKRPQIMQSTLCSYLVMTSHPIAFTLKTCKPKRLSMPWRTLNNSIDCGVFAMRHMETFKDTSVKEWKCGLTSESDEQQK
ncbi:hypothetical protein R6Q57_018527 [Mikania cordata]